MIGGEAAVGVIYSGEMLYIQNEVKELGLDYNLKLCSSRGKVLIFSSTAGLFRKRQAQRNAEKWINFLYRPDIAKKNFEYIHLLHSKQRGFRSC